MLSNTLALTILLLLACLSQASPINAGLVAEPGLEKRGEKMECLPQYGSPLYDDCMAIISVMKTGFLLRMNEEIWDHYSYGSCTVDIRSEGFIMWMGSWVQMSHNVQLLIDACVGNNNIKSGGFRHLDNGGDPGVNIRVSGYEDSPPILPDSNFKIRWEKLSNGDKIQHYRAVPQKDPRAPTKPLSAPALWSVPYNTDAEWRAAVAAVATAAEGAEAGFGIDTDPNFQETSSLARLSSFSSILGTCSRSTDCSGSDVCVYRPTHSLLARLRVSLRRSASGTRRAAAVEDATARADALPLWGVCSAYLGP